MNTPPLAHIDEASLLRIAPHGAIRMAAKNVIVVNEGDATDSLYILLSGRVKAFTTGPDGREVVFDVINAGDYFGELVLDGGPRAASIMTLEACRFYVIPKYEVEALLASHPEFARDLIHKLIGKVRLLTDKVSDLTLKDVYGRFMRFIDANAVEHDGARVIRERLTQHDIAARIGGSREMVSRILRDLTTGAYISMESRQISILKKLPEHW